MITVQEQPERTTDPYALSSTGGLTRLRVLVVDDHPAVRLGVLQLLDDQPDFTVVDAACTADEARSLAEREPIDVGILDINLAGETAYPVAHILQALGIPFVFITGYGAEAISTPFPEIQVFQKPIEREIMRNLFVPRSGPLCENEVPRDMSATEMAATSLQRAS